VGYREASLKRGFAAARVDVHSRLPDGFVVDDQR
jgi:hypothetical protein